MLDVGLKANNFCSCAVQDRVAALLRMGADAATSMNNELRVQLVKIPKQVSKSGTTASVLMHSCRFVTSS